MVFKRKRAPKQNAIGELKELLFADDNRESDGILAQASKLLSGDLAAKKIARIKEIVENL